MRTSSGISAIAASPSFATSRPTPSAHVTPRSSACAGATATEPSGLLWNIRRALALLEVLDRVTGTPVVRTPILGGSLPLATFEDALGATVIVLPTVNHDNAQHAPNENLRMQNLWDGIELLASVLVELGTAWR